MKVNLVDLDSTLGSTAPPHLRIIDVIELLFGPLKEHDRSPKSRGSEVFRPVTFLPIRACWLSATRDQHFLFCDSPVAGKPFSEAHLIDVLQTLAIIINSHNQRLWLCCMTHVSKIANRATSSPSLSRLRTICSEMWVPSHRPPRQYGP